MQPDPTTLFDLIGVRPVIVDQLGHDAILLPQHRMVLIDAGVDPVRMDLIIDRILAEAAARLV